LRVLLTASVERDFGYMARDFLQHSVADVMHGKVPGSCLFQRILHEPELLEKLYAKCQLFCCGFDFKSDRATFLQGLGLPLDVLLFQRNGFGVLVLTVAMWLIQFGLASDTVPLLLPVEGHLQGSAAMAQVGTLVGYGVTVVYGERVLFNALAVDSDQSLVLDLSVGDGCWTVGLSSRFGGTLTNSEYLQCSGGGQGLANGGVSEVLNWVSE
jgi:hypothetical protein